MKDKAAIAISNDRVGDWIQTYTGRQFWPLDPRSDEVYIEDIAAALSKLCRFAGHCQRFYSVAEHCVHLASAAPPDLRFAALMHDAAEAYVVDLPRPIKRSLVEYSTIEARLMRVIATRFDFQWPCMQVSILDDRILADERDQNMAKPPMPWFSPRVPLGVKLKCWAPD